MIGTVKDFNIPADLAKTMLEGVRLSDYATTLPFSAVRAGVDYVNILKMAQEMYREARTIKRIPEVEPSVDRRYIAGMEGKFSSTSKETPIEYKAPPKGATPFATQRRSIYFETGSANMSVDSRAVVDEIGNFMRAYENTVVDIEGNTDSTGAREINMELSKQRADAVKDYLTKKHGFPRRACAPWATGRTRPSKPTRHPKAREEPADGHQGFRQPRRENDARPLYHPPTHRRQWQLILGSRPGRCS